MIYVLRYARESACFSWLLITNTNYMILSFMKSWANAVVVDVVEVVVVDTAISGDITHVVVIVSRTQPEIKKD